MDSLLIILIWYKTGHTFGNIAATMPRMTEKKIQTTVDRMRPLLNQVLRDTWWTTRPRPMPFLGNRDFQHVALLVDSTSMEVYRPKGRFEEVKPMWDAKNHIYALKKEVAVTANPPHFALFSFPATIGSQHDFQYFKNHSAEYEEYLAKTLEERADLPDDVSPNWAVCADSAYIGQNPVRRVTVPKRSAANQTNAQAIKEMRVPIEQFFGHLKSSWHLVKRVYRNDHGNFDLDFDNCVLLTNELLAYREVLSESDFLYYQNFNLQRKRKVMQKEEKEKIAKRRHATLKRRRIQYNNLRAEAPGNRANAVV
jgi:hypothetical protein